MKNYIGTTFLAIGASLVSHAYAESWFYVERPNFIEHQDHFTCAINPGYAFNSCLLYEDATERVLVSNGQRTQIRDENLRVFVTCSDGFCEANQNQYLGRSEHGFFATIPLYYYVWGAEASEDGDILINLYKRGTGPAANELLGWHVENDDQPVASANKEILAFFCDQGDVDECFVRFEDMSEGWLTASEVATQFDPVDPNDPEYDMLGVECGASGACDTMRGVIVGYDPSHPAFQ